MSKGRGVPYSVIVQHLGMSCLFARSSTENATKLDHFISEGPSFLRAYNSGISEINDNWFTFVTDEQVSCSNVSMQDSCAMDLLQK
jgi:hypothetical protein